MATGPVSARSTFALAATATFLVTLDATLVFAAFAALRAEFHAVSPATLSWTLNAYTVGFAALLVPAGRLADLVGRKRVFRAQIVVFTLAAVACALAPDAPPRSACSVRPSGRCSAQAWSSSARGAGCSSSTGHSAPGRTSPPRAASASRPRRSTARGSISPAAPCSSPGRRASPPRSCSPIARPGRRRSSRSPAAQRSCRASSPGHVAGPTRRSISACSAPRPSAGSTSRRPSSASPSR